MRRTFKFSLLFVFAVMATRAVSVEWDMSALAQTPRVFDAPAEVERPDGVNTICFEGLPFRGKPTRVFAYYGVPASASPENPVPGIVLVHGAGGTAFADWVKLWVDRGYAAIAFDTDGNLPIGKYSAWMRNPEGGPRRGDISQLKWPVTDQWMYHAVADTMLAHSLLASFPEVDAQRIGATGISWGGVILANTAGVDSRLKFAAMVYGCGFIAEETDDGSSFVGQRGTAEQRAEWSALWDPRNRLSQAKMPMLWLAGADDFAFTPKARQQSYFTAQGPQTLSLNVHMPHSQGRGAVPQEILVFAESVVKSGKPLAHVVTQGQDEQTAWATYDSSGQITRAELNYTSASGRWQDRLWETTSATVSSGRVSAVIPDGVTVYFFNLFDERGLIVSTRHVELTTP